MRKDNEALLAISVRSGRHAGTYQKISVQTFSIGSSFESDLVLTDPSVAPCHARLSLDDRAFKVEAIGAPLRMNGAEVAARSTAETRLPARLRVGEIDIVVSPAGRQASSLTPLARVLMGLAALLIVGGGGVLMLQTEDGFNSLFGAKQGARADRLVPSSQTARPSPEQVQAAAGTLEKRLIAAKISTIIVAARGGIVNARGTVTPALKDGWNALQLWFDETYGRSIVLRSEVTVVNPVAPEPPIAIQSVWTGKQPYVIDGQGNKHFEGVVLKDGWIIEHIGSEKVTLVRNTQRIVLTF